MGKRKKETTSNLLHVDAELLSLVNKYSLNKTFLAAKFYGRDWDISDKAERAKLSMRFRSKLDGTGSINDEEHQLLQTIISDIAASIQKGVEESITRRTQRTKDVQEFTERLIEEGIIHKQDAVGVQDEIIRIINNVNAKKPLSVKPEQTTRVQTPNTEFKRVFQPHTTE
jgi:hypothetical protein